MVLLGIDIGTSFIKVGAVDASTRQIVAAVQCPDNENPITAHQPGWAEQSPEMWWQQTLEAIGKLVSEKKIKPEDVCAIGISYQMHGLVLVDKNQQVLRDSIIWCDSRAVAIGEEALNDIGEEVCASCLLNSPGNFTASKLAWVKKNEPEIYEKIDKVLLPGDFIAMKLTGHVTTTSSALSEGILWNFKNDALSGEVIQHFGFPKQFFPPVSELVSSHGTILPELAKRLGLKNDVKVTYKAGDQPNNALSLNVLQPGEVAANAGTSGVIYAVTDRPFADKYSRVNSFIHVNHTKDSKRIGVLLCINGAAIMNSWVRKICGNHLSYKQMDERAAAIPPGSEGLMILPFGNGAERMLKNSIVGAQLCNIDLNKHTRDHIYRAVQEGIAFAFRYGLDIMRENGVHPKIIRAGRANLFLSEIFIHSFVNATGVGVELYQNDGSAGAAIGAGVGAGVYASFSEAFTGIRPQETFEPNDVERYETLYRQWKQLLGQRLV